MIDIEFNFNRTKEIIKADMYEPLQYVIDRYIQKSLLDFNTIYFIKDGNKIINPQNPVESFMNDLDKKNKRMIITVNMIEKNNEDKEQVKAELKDIICPKCKEPCRISIDNYNIKLYDCINGHIVDSIKFDDYEKTQELNESQTVCDICKLNNKGNCKKDEFFKCLNCKSNLCLFCKTNHDARHNIILYNQKNYICQTHYQPLIKYCSKCKKNICNECKEHDEHDSILFVNIVPNLEEKKKILDEIKICINSINASIKEVIIQLNKFSEDINQFYEINKNILNNYRDNNHLNFQILKNLDEINNNNKIYEKLRKINSYHASKEKVFDILILYENLNNIMNDSIINIEHNEIKEENNHNDFKSMNNKINEMTIIYGINHLNRIKLFDFEFIEKNKFMCYLMINGEKTELKDSIEVNSNYQKQIEIKLCEIDTITNMNSIFRDCISLRSLPDIDKWDTKNVTNMSYMFYGCTALNSLPDISKWDMKNVTNMDSMFYGCISLKSLPDISNWNTQNVTNMGNMFHNCNSLISLPDISNWNTQNVIYIYSMFEYCILLKSLPDISNWDLGNVTNMSAMFQDCKSLESLPDISKWNVRNVTNMNYMFNNCSSLNSFPNISKWKLNKNLNKDNVFEGVDKNIIPKNFKGCLIY